MADYCCDTCIYAVAMMVRHKRFVNERTCPLHQKGECLYSRNEAGPNSNEQLEMDLEVCRQNIADLRKELQETEEKFEDLMHDLDSITRDGNPFEASFLRMKWGFDE